VRRCAGERDAERWWWSMSKKSAQRITSAKVASKAAKVLTDPKATAAEKSAAGSALSQRPSSKKR